MNQFGAQFFLIYLLLSLHVSGNYVPIIRRKLPAQIFLLCLLLFSTCFGQLCAHHQEKITCTNFLTMFISFLYMFRATMCPPSGENTVPMRHLVFVTLYRWMSGMQGLPCTPDSHLYRVTNTRCRIGTEISPDDGHTVARSMLRKAINILRKIVHQVGSIYKTRHYCCVWRQLYTICLPCMLLRWSYEMWQQCVDRYSSTTVMEELCSFDIRDWFTSHTHTQKKKW